MEQPNTWMFRTTVSDETGQLISVKREMVDVANDLDHWVDLNPHMEIEPDSASNVDYEK